MRLIIVFLLAISLFQTGIAYSNPPHGRYLGSFLACDDGYKAVGSECQKLPDIAGGHGRYLGSFLACDDGYKAVGSECQKLPDIAGGHGRYLGSFLACDDGYKAVGSECQKLPDIAGGHGRYLGSFLTCDDGYKAVNGRCESLTGVANNEVSANELNQGVVPHKRSVSKKKNPEIDSNHPEVKIQPEQYAKERAVAPKMEMEPKKAEESYVKTHGRENLEGSNNYAYIIGGLFLVAILLALMTCGIFWFLLGVGCFIGSVLNLFMFNLVPAICLFLIMLFFFFIGGLVETLKGN